MKDLLLDVLVLLFPMLIYQILGLSIAGSSREKWLKPCLGILCGISIVCSLNLPFLIEDELFGDMRFIPLIIAVLYGGYRAGWIASAFYLICLIFMGWGGLFLAYVSFFLMFLLSWVCSLSIQGRSPRIRIAIASGLALVGFFATLAAHMFHHQVGITWIYGLGVYIGVAGVHLASAAGIAFLIELSNGFSRMREQLHRTEKLNLLGQLAASVAHEIRSPLTVIRGFTQLMERNLDYRNGAYMKQVKLELNRMEFIINDFLNYAKPQLGRIEILQLSRLVREIGEELCSVEENGRVPLIVNPIREDLYVRGDGFKLKQACIHLIHNGLEALHLKGGTVSVSVTRANDGIMIRIADTGKGMTQEELGRLGQPFYTTKSKGTGLGLMITFRIVEAMDGQLEFTSKEGQGTEAVIRLPAHEGA
ncbi:HAMP domain-containing sensor histidine kinase [Paenibacillus sp. J2TS4]|uniref:sensor histidine kinase n=1 Tax=Paenibacillus sp. J2TS4 TaxID=2807194 RepID=UPI001B1BE141|nr:HAMP domain-containing sensor histidine kinase [Paenibacillus sp. J2TS4]GIP34158.1 two-component sensor histidine kinase [Paenibacillus sp. J2TS4]